MARPQSFAKHKEVAQGVEKRRYDPPHPRAERHGLGLNPATIGPYHCGRGQRMLVIAGPCVIETQELTLSIAVRLKRDRRRVSICRCVQGVVRQGQSHERRLLSRPGT